MARRSQCSSQGDNPLDPHYLPPHYREEYRLAVDALVEEDLPGYYEFLKCANLVEFLCPPEVDHIRRTVQFPSQSIQSGLPYLEEVDSASSDTYWPLHSDLDAPSLDLGWPAPRSFLGPTEVTMLVNPSDPNMPSIKEQARRLICSAQQVIAVVMDIFTDVDIFGDLLDATMRNVAVYILLDELNAHYFTGMAASCKVNLERVHPMRIRTVSGSTYFCKTGKSFRGQMMDRFLLVDCKAVLGGNYSFMWSFEKIHRCIAHLFFGELVTTYDEEFRILYAQSQDLFAEKALEKGPGESGYSSNTSQSFRGQLPIQSSRYASHFRQPFGNKIDLDPNMLPFKRGEPFCSSLEPSQMQMYTTAYPSKHLRIEQSSMEQDRSMMTSWKMEMAYKRHSYAEGSHDSYGSSRQLMKHQLISSSLEEMENQGPHAYKEQPYYHGFGPGSGHGINCNIKGQRYNQKDQYVDIGCPLEVEPPRSYSPREDYLSSSSSKDIIHDSANNEINRKRMNMNQSYICQTSPNQLNPSDLNPVNTEACLNRQPQDPGSKQGLRNWRINSFLTTLNNEDEGLAVPLGQDPFDEPSSFAEPMLPTTDPPVTHFNTDEFQRMTTSKEDIMPQYSRSNQPGMPKHPSEKHASMASDSKVTSEALELSSSTNNDKAGEVEVREPRGISIPIQESFCSRTNPLLQRSSRLRSSLLFSSCNLDKKYSTMVKSASENLTEEGGDPLKTSSVSKKEPKLVEVVEDKTAAQSSANVPLDTSDSKFLKKGILKPQKDDLNMVCDNELCTDAKNAEKLKIQTAGRHGATILVPADQRKSTAVSEATDRKSKEPTEGSSEKSLMDPLTKEKPKLLEKTPPEKKKIITAPTESLPIVPFFINMDDPEMRFLYFKQLAAERKAAKMSKESAVGPVLPENATDTSLRAVSTSENQADIKMKLTDMSAMQKVPDFLEGSQRPTKTLTDKRPISSTSIEPISNKKDVSVTPELGNKTPAIVKQSAESGPPYGDSKTSDVRMVTKDSPNVFKKYILKQPKDSQSLNISCDKNIHHDATDTKKHGIKNASVQSSPSLALADLGKSQNKPTDWNCDKSSGVQEATDQKSKKTTSEKSSKDLLLKEEPKPAVMKPFRITPEDRHVITAATESSPSTPCFLSVKSQKPSGWPKESAARGPVLSENTTDSNLEMSGTSPSLNDSNMKMTPANPITPTKHISHEAECSVAPKLENQTPAVVKKPAGLDLQSKGSVSPDITKATEASPKLFGRDILKPPEEAQNPKTGGKLKQEVSALERNSQNVVSVSGTIEDQKVAAVADDKPISQTESSLPEICEKAICLESQSHTEAKQATEIVITKSKEENADHKIVSAASKADQSRFQTCPNNVIYSCNLRDDTKVILEQISANSQNRIDLAKKGEGSTDDAKMGMKERSAVMEGTPSMPHQRGTRFQRTPVNPQERESALKRMETMRKEKKVYSRFEVLG